MEARPTAIIYARVSSSKQAQEQLPIESQIEVTLQRAQALNASVLKVFRDEGRSGRTANREAFQNAITFCELNRVDYFITWHSDRFARDHIDDGTFRKRLKQFGTMVVEVADGVDPKSQEAWFYVALRALLNEKRSADIGRDTKRSLMKNARDGYFNGGRLPFGYRSIQEGRRNRLDIEPAEAPVIKRIFAEYIGGAGCKAIAVALNAEGITKRGDKWSKANVGLILKNHRYTGTTIFNRTNGIDRTENPEAEWVITRSHPGIISEEMFMQVQTMLKDRAPGEGGGSPKSQAVFTGMLRCAECDALMQTETATGRGGKRYKYYNCSSWLKKGLCKSRRIGADAFDEWLSAQLLGSVLTRQELERITQHLAESAGSWAQTRAEERTRIVAELRQIETKQAKLFDVLETMGREAPGIGDVMSRLKAHSDRMQALQDRMAELEATPDLPPLKLDLDEAREFLGLLILEESPPEGRRAFFASFVRSVRIGKNSTAVEYFPDKIVNQLGVRLVHSEKRWLPDHVLLRTAKATFALPDEFLAKAA